MSLSRRDLMTTAPAAAALAVAAPALIGRAQAQTAPTAAPAASPAATQAPGFTATRWAPSK